MAMFDFIQNLGLANDLDSWALDARRSRPDRYLRIYSDNSRASNALRFNLPDKYTIMDYDPLETVPPLVQNLIGHNTTKAAWHKLAN